MVSRLNGREIKRMRQELLDKYLVEICSRCGKTPKQLHVPHLELHETKYVRPLNPDNFVWLCHGCNHIKSLNRINILRRNPTPEHQVSLTVKPLFRKWLLGEILKPENNHHVPYDQIVKQGAYEMDVDIETIKRWLEPLCDHPTSPYVTRDDNRGVTQIWETESAPEDEEGVL